MAFPFKPISCFIVFTFLPSLIGGILYFKDHTNARIALYLQLSSCALWWPSILFALCANPQKSTPKKTLLLAVSLFFLITITPLFIDYLVKDYKAEHRVRIDVQDTRLTEFSLNSSILTYNLTMSIIIGPNQRKRAVQFTHFVVQITYQDQPFVSASLPPFVLEGIRSSASNTSSVILHRGFQGYGNISLPPDALKIFKLDSDAGRFTLKVIVSFRGFRILGREFRGKKVFPLEEIPSPHATGEWVKINNDASVNSRNVALVFAGEWDTINDDASVNYGNVALFFVIVFLARLLFLWRSIRKEQWISMVKITVNACFGLIVATIFCILWIVAAVKEGNRSIWHVSDVTLSNFNYSPNGTLKYDLSLAVVIGPNTKELGLYVEKLEVELSYLDQKFASFSLPSSYLQPKHSDGGRNIIFNRRVEGEEEFGLRSEELRVYERDSEAKRFEIVAKISYEGSRTNDYDFSPETLDFGGGHVKRVKLLKIKAPLMDHL